MKVEPTLDKYSTIRGKHLEKSPLGEFPSEGSPLVQVPTWEGHHLVPTAPFGSGGDTLRSRSGPSQETTPFMSERPRQVPG